MSEVLNVEEIFASKVFTFGKMKEKLPRSVYKEVRKVMDQGGRAVSGHCRCGRKSHEGLGC